MIHLHGRDTTPRTVATLVRPERVERGRPATPATAESVSDEDDAVTMDTNRIVHQLIGGLSDYL